MTVEQLIKKLLLLNPQVIINFLVHDDESGQFYPQDSAELVIEKDLLYLRIYQSDDKHQGRNEKK